MDGLLVIDKPLNCTSMDVIRVLRKITGIKKIGHAGTLDPLATGVLLVCLGKATKSISKFMDLEKEYITEIDLSAFSETDDAQGPLAHVECENIPSQNEIKKCLGSFIGNIEQMPPKYSAIKIKGIPAYKRVRKGEKIELKPRFVYIKSIRLLSYKWPKLTIEIVCSKGTYIRSLARDIGKKLNTGGYVHSLQRTRIGSYSIDGAADLKSLQENSSDTVQKILRLVK